MKTNFKKLIPLLLLFSSFLFSGCETQEIIVKNEKLTVENKVLKS
jgi:hypothetical protein